MVGQRSLKPSVEVRFLPPQPKISILFSDEAGADHAVYLQHIRDDITAGFFRYINDAVGVIAFAFVQHLNDVHPPLSEQGRYLADHVGMFLFMTSNLNSEDGSSSQSG